MLSFVERLSSFGGYLVLSVYMGGLSDLRDGGSRAKGGPVDGEDL